MAHFNQSSSSEQTPCDLIEDRISNLPCHVLSIILSYLPILDAVRTNILSREWRNKWLSLSEFVLDSNVISLEHETSDSSDRSRKIITELVNTFLSHHFGPITKFYLRTDCGTNDTESFRWIRILSTQDVKLLSLKEDCEFCFRVPSILFSYKKLIGLLLKRCSLKVPSDFGGFNSLRELILRHVTIDCGDLNRLILSCSILEKLTLLQISELTLLRIHAPRLTSLVVDTEVEDIVIGAAPFLMSVIVVDAHRYPWERIMSLGVIRGFFGLGSIKHLAIPGDIIKLLAVDYGTGNFPWRNSSLVSLTFDAIHFQNVEVFHGCLSILNSCLNVNHFLCRVLSAKGQKLVAQFVKENRGQFSFPELRSLVMIIPEGSGMGCAVNFLQFISTHSPNLEFITVVKEGEIQMNTIRVFQMLTRLRKLCPQAVVRFAQNAKRTKLDGKNLSVTE